jgi:hypothetical protein
VQPGALYGNRGGKLLGRNEGETRAAGGNYSLVFYFRNTPDVVAHRTILEGMELRDYYQGNFIIRKREDAFESTLLLRMKTKLGAIRVQ